MRALGPGSVSSFLKTMLDVVYVALCVLVVVLAVVAVFALLLSFNPSLLPNVWLKINGEEDAPTGLASAGMLFALCLSLAGVLVIVRTLRQIFTTLTAGDPFHPQNVRRLRLIGAVLAILELGRYAVWAISTQLSIVSRIEPNLSLTAWFSVLVVFVLAEVFREGARLRREAELTI